MTEGKKPKKSGLEHVMKIVSEYGIINVSGGLGIYMLMAPGWSKHIIDGFNVAPFIGAGLILLSVIVNLWMWSRKNPKSPPQPASVDPEFAKTIEWMTEEISGNGNSKVKED